MPRSSRRHSGGRGGGGSRKTGYWDGLQWPLTSVAGGGSQTLLELVGATATEFMPRTMVAVKGQIVIVSASVSSDDMQQQIRMVELNDAGGLTGEVNAIDTNEEDIARRILWSNTAHSISSAVHLPVTIEVDIKVKIKIPPTGKHIIALLQSSVTGSRMSTVGYLRCYLRDN